MFYIYICIHVFIVYYILLFAVSIDIVIFFSLLFSLYFYLWYILLWSELKLRLAVETERFLLPGAVQLRRCIKWVLCSGPNQAVPIRDKKKVLDRKTPQNVAQHTQTTSTCIFPFILFSFPFYYFFFLSSYFKKTTKRQNSRISVQYYSDVLFGF